MRKQCLLLASVCLLIAIQSVCQGAMLNQRHVTPEVQVEEAAALIERIVPGAGGSFSLSIMAKQGKRDVFEIEQVGDQIALRGSSGVALASAFNYYLKEYCRCHVSWCGDQLNLPSPLPAVPKPVRIVGLHQYRVYFNYCTLNYTASWWDWKRWEREIDIMALNGINMPLSVTGLEGAWYHALLKIGFTDEEARTFLVGPCFFAWQWMTNIEGHGGPLPKEWIDSHIVLGRKILERQRSLGMTPIQQGFSGYVPRLFKTKFPKAAISQTKEWCAFPGTCQLDPLDPLFQRFGRIFLETSVELFGTSHVYATDPFHEGHPPKPGKTYLNQVGSRIWKLLHDFDPDAIWAMQSWSIRQHITSRAPKHRLIVLDLAGRKNDFWGYPFVKGQLHNFGGRINLHGDLAAIAGNPFARAAKKIKENVGMGLFMEGIEQNPVFYEMVFDSIWRDRAVDPVKWLESYARRRYGAESAAANRAWRILLNGPYGPGTSGVELSSIIAARPAIRPLKSGPNAGFGIPYDPRTLAEAWTLLLEDAEVLKASDPYQFDLMDVGRQVLSNLGQELQKRTAAAYEAKDRKALKKESEAFLKLLSDVDELLATREEYSFDRWVRTARGWGRSEELKDYYEWNASMLVSIWGPANNPLIFDYSWREWASLIRLYYLPRWKTFYEHLDNALATGMDYRDPKELTHGRHALRANDFYSKLADWEIAWTRQRHEVLAGPTGNTVELSKELHAAYVPLIEKIYSAKPGKDKHPRQPARRGNEFENLGQ